MSNLKFQNQDGLIPVVIQEEQTGDILMLGYMNNIALRKTLNERIVYFWSRSRKILWMKGEESGNKLKVSKIYQDCDQDSILIKVELLGKNVCHTGNKTCFYERIVNDS